MVSLYTMYFKKKKYHVIYKNLAVATIYLTTITVTLLQQTLGFVAHNCNTPK